MSLVQTFVDAFKKGVGKKPAKPDVDMKSVGPMGSVPEGYADKFDTLRPMPESGSAKGRQRPRARSGRIPPGGGRERRGRRRPSRADVSMNGGHGRRARPPVTLGQWGPIPSRSAARGACWSACSGGLSPRPSPRPPSFSSRALAPTPISLRPRSS